MGQVEFIRNFSVFVGFGVKKGRPDLFFGPDFQKNRFAGNALTFYRDSAAVVNGGFIDGDGHYRRGCQSRRRGCYRNWRNHYGVGSWRGWRGSGFRLRGLRGSCRVLRLAGLNIIRPDCQKKQHKDDDVFFGNHNFPFYCVYSIMKDSGYRLIKVSGSEYFKNVFPLHEV